MLDTKLTKAAQYDIIRNNIYICKQIFVMCTRYINSAQWLSQNTRAQLGSHNKSTRTPKIQTIGTITLNKQITLFHSIPNIV